MPQDIQTLVGPIANGCAMLIVAWVVYYVFRTLLPQMAKDRKEERAEERASFLKSLSEIEKRCEDGHAMARASFNKEIAVLRTSLEANTRETGSLTTAIREFKSNVRHAG